MEYQWNSATHLYRREVAAPPALAPSAQGVGRAPIARKPPLRNERRPSIIRAALQRECRCSRYLGSWRPEWQATSATNGDKEDWILQRLYSRVLHGVQFVRFSCDGSHRLGVAWQSSDLASAFRWVGVETHRLCRRYTFLMIHERGAAAEVHVGKTARVRSHRSDD